MAESTPNQENTTRANIQQVRDADLRGLVAISLQIYMMRFASIAGVAALIGLPANVYFALYGFPVPQSAADVGAMLPRMLVTNLFNLLAVLAIAYIVELTIYAEQPSMNDAINHALVRWLPGVGTFLFSLAATFTGSLLFILPGVALSIFLFFDMYVVSLRDLSMVPALGYTFRLVQGRWWQTFGRVFFILLLVLIPTLFIGIPGAASGETVAPVILVMYDTLHDVIFAFAIVAYTLLFLNLDYRKHSHLLEDANGTAGA